MISFPELLKGLLGFDRDLSRGIGLFGRTRWPLVFLNSEQLAEVVVFGEFGGSGPRDVACFVCSGTIDDGKNQFLYDGS